MADSKQYIAIDLGAESGRVMLAEVSSERLVLEEVHRFSNGPVEQAGSLRWDFDLLMSQIKTGVAKAAKKADGDIAGIGVDSWGVDFGLIDENGKLMENPFHYRDSRTDGMFEKAFELMPKRQIYDNTGIQFMQLNTIYQLLAARLADSEALSKAKYLIFIADLVAYNLCGEIFAEYSLASTSQLMDMNTGQWSKPIFEQLGLPIDIMPRTVQPGTVVGKLTADVAAELGCQRIAVIASGSHDTAVAVAAVPAKPGNWAYLSSGTWSLMGVETPKAIITDKSFNYSFTNEGGVQNTIRFLKNIMGLWLLQECRRQWQREDHDLSYQQITEMAQKATPFTAYIDTDYEQFISPGDMPARINSYLTQSGQQLLTDKGQIARAILESLALRYRRVMSLLEEMSGIKVDVLHIVGGGIQNELLCQFTADATGKKVITGPVEATASGNIIMQAIATGQIDSLVDAREIMAKSFPLKTYTPVNTHTWAEQYDKFCGE